MFNPHVSIPNHAVTGQIPGVQIGFAHILLHDTCVVHIDTLLDSPESKKRSLSYYSNITPVLQVFPTERKSNLICNSVFPPRHRSVNVFPCTGGCRLDLERVRKLVAALWRLNLDNIGVRDE